jgi:hypothetical protein
VIAHSESTKGRTEEEPVPLDVAHLQGKREPGLSRWVEVIGDFSQRVQEAPNFFRGFSTAQLGEITVAKDPRGLVAYRTFTLNCQSERKL